LANRQCHAPLNELVGRTDGQHDADNDEREHLSTPDILTPDQYLAGY
jgi:hypothetical protein